MKALEIRPRVQECLDEFIKDQRPTLNKVSPSLDPLADFAHEFLSGGKRLRAAFCYWGYIGAGGKDSQEIISAATALELLQACALVHDDVMDASDTRRGKPSIHKRFETMHQDSKWLGDKKFHASHRSNLLRKDSKYYSQFKWSEPNNLEYVWPH
jgi:geranylgeranyl diphosphate synthase type I